MSIVLDKRGGTSLREDPSEVKGKRESPIPMTMTHSWHESYMAAVIETDGTKMQARVQAAESAINERQRILSEDHGGTPEERQAIADAMNCLKVLQERCSLVAGLASAAKVSANEG